MAARTCLVCGKPFEVAPSVVRRGYGVFCSHQCSWKYHGSGAKTRASRLTNLRETAEARFWARVSRKGPDDCWEWTGTINRCGYAYVWWNSKQRLVHRVAISLTDGDWESQLDVLHSCDNPICCNAKHLWRGTHYDNMRDMIDKGRKTPAFGEANGSAKLTEQDVAAIRASKKRGIDLAAEYEISPTNISDIRKRRIWRHVP